MSKGMYTCKVCGRDFALIFEERYTARDEEKTGITAAIVGQQEAEWYDAFDCPHCGCQNVIQPRKQPVREFDICTEDEPEKEE